MHADPILLLADFRLPILSLAYGVSQSNIIGNNEASATAQDEGESQICSGLVLRSGPMIFGGIWYDARKQTARYRAHNQNT